MIDLEKLSPAPWFAWIVDGPPSISPYGPYGKVNGPKTFTVDRSEVMEPTDAEFIALARNAFEVMARRDWGIGRDEDGWYPINGDMLCHVYCNRVTKIDRDDDLPVWPDPFTALVEADAWYKANVEDKTGHAG